MEHDFVSCSQVLGADALVVASADTLHSDDRNPEICLCVSRWSTHGSAGTLKLGGVIDVEDDDGDMEWNGTSAWSRSMDMAGMEHRARAWAWAWTWKVGGYTAARQRPQSWWRGGGVGKERETGVTGARERGCRGQCHPVDARDTIAVHK